MPVSGGSMDVRSSISLVLGPMFAGKTRELVRHWKEASSRGINVLVLKPEMDTRYDREMVVAHSGEAIPAIPISSWPEIPDGTGLVLLDEVQFFQEPWFKGRLVDCLLDLRERGIDVVASGLSTDWRRNVFPVVQDLLCVADILVSLSARCSVCGGVAHYTAKVSSGEAVVELGGRDLYEPRCLKHHDIHDPTVIIDEFVMASRMSYGNSMDCHNKTWTDSPD